MRWTQLAAALMVAFAATVCLAETPEVSGNRPQAMQLLQGGRLFSGQGWWNRYGEPVNATALAQAESSPSDQSVPAGPMPMYGDGYVYGPGSCDCPPPCIWHLWAGYFQNPHRCHMHQGRLHGRCGACGDGCGPCGTGGALAGGGWGLFRHGCGCGSPLSCTTQAACGCGAPVSCSAAVADCGCAPVCGKCRTCHLGGHFKGLLDHWNRCCDSCSAPLGCGCSVPADASPSDEKQVITRRPL